MKLADGSTHDVVYIATMANHARLWMVQLGTPIKGSRQIDEHLINDHWGILSTPVIDAAAGVLMHALGSARTGHGRHGQHFLAALRLSDGSLMHPLLSLEGVSYHPGHGRPVQNFRSMERKQRAALLPANGAVFIGSEPLPRAPPARAGG